MFVDVSGPERLRIILPRSGHDRAGSNVKRESHLWMDGEMSLFRRNYLNITKCFEAFLTKFHCKTRVLIGTGWNEDISNTMLVNPYRPGFQLTGNSAERSRITAPN